MKVRGEPILKPLVFPMGETIDATLRITAERREGGNINTLQIIYTFRTPATLMVVGVLPLGYSVPVGYISRIVGGVGTL